MLCYGSELNLVDRNIGKLTSRETVCLDRPKTRRQRLKRLVIKSNWNSSLHQRTARKVVSSDGHLSRTPIISSDRLNCFVSTDDTQVVLMSNCNYSGHITLCLFPVTHYPAPKSGNKLFHQLECRREDKANRRMKLSIKYMTVSLTDQTKAVWKGYKLLIK